MRQSETVLILTGRFGNGHYSVAEALAEEYAAQGLHTQIVDVIQVVFPKLYKVIYGVFNRVICRYSGIYNFSNSFGRKERKAKANEKLLQKINELKPDRIVITWSGCSKLLGELPIPVQVCVTDLGVHRGWLFPGAQKYLAANQSVAEKLNGYGVPRSKIEIRGIPVKMAFHWDMKIASSKKQVLIMGGGLGIIPWLRPVIEELITLDNTEITVIAGRNERLLRTLKKRYPTVKAIGFTDELQRYLSKADLVLSKPGGVSIFESIYVGTPFIAMCPAYEHEVENAEYLLQHGLGAVVWNVESSGKQLSRIVNDPEFLRGCRRNMLDFKHELAREQVGETKEFAYVG